MTPKFAKITGEVILVLSFLTQNILFDYYNDKSSDLEKAYTNQALIDKGAEIKELKYFVADFPGDSMTTVEYKELNINMAARKIAQAQMMAIIGSNRPKQEQIDLSDSLLQKANTVRDFDSYMDFIGFVNKNSLQANDIISNINRINDNKSFSRIIFIILYITGTGLLIYSACIEKS